MEYVTKLLMLAVIGGFIGWITNYIAIKLLFRPFKPVKLLFGYKIQGVIPARKPELAVSIGNVIEKQLLSPEEIINKLVSEKDINYLKEAIVTNVINILKDKLPGFLHGFTDRTVKKHLEDFMEKDGDRYIREMINNIVRHAAEKITISEMVTEKINALDLVTFESIVLSVVNKELKHIEYLGGVLGFIIGLIQGTVALLF
ncbi:hypothetical protein Cst_c12800 [Thermoclostridium stercorarium subsp. stercorarium DSM 8532]|jgi:uncharacterized membrane protein YheB (UPF0754 family)|uniref:DUF445 domain-containing protein n=2 Tax=Thermoclostridium stercorarium TaxID=1510 RepID=L7VPA0_THES1|nr:DUF445 family protein [Thermoclostridium stercorarium]AGC68271.1 hypothetical protein Cst_c12800 [Thermoclostridium stercorarium subsp. stercorarium DSM 8532]AGI39298.1 hypothetical protein Clst_1237 [Thermoclostridium stercorarium subsp. stercorarium DSM 8532]ANW98631.1 hypothetical protein CSTERTH_06075 [Thermoclostridium stercorarium subsp. thermolacticum DSM 2910]UZQ86786.1 DUF445 family protein [Thermoclostridium stercorarium]